MSTEAGQPHPRLNQQSPSISLADPTLDEGERAEVPFTEAEPVIAVRPNIYDGEHAALGQRQDTRRASYSGGPVLNTDEEMIGPVYADPRSEDIAYANTPEEVESFLAETDPTTEADC